MGFKEENADILEALAWHEAAISEYYKACASLSEETAGFWESLAAEEANHSALLLASKDLTKDADGPLFEKGPINLGLVESSTKFIRRELERLKERPNYTLGEALAIASKIENSFFERHVFEAFKNSPSIKLQETARIIGAETTNHAKAIGKLILERKASQEKRDVNAAAPAGATPEAKRNEAKKSK